MAFVPIDPALIEAGDPVTQELFGLVKDNFSDHETRITDLENIAAVSVLTGEIRAYGSIVAPSGWLLCNGAIYLQATYPDLFAVIGTSYNQGGEAGTEFRVPESRGRNILGVGNSPTAGITTRLIGDLGGVEVHNHPMPHTHTVLHSHTWLNDGNLANTEFTAQTYNSTGTAANITSSFRTGGTFGIPIDNGVNWAFNFLGGVGTGNNQSRFTSINTPTTSASSAANTALNTTTVDPFFVAQFIIKT